MKFIKIITFLMFCFNIVTNPTLATEIEQPQNDLSPVELSVDKTDDFAGNVGDTSYEPAEENSTVIELKAENNHFFNDIKLNGAIQGLFNYTQPIHGSNSANFKFYDTHLWVTGKALNENTDFRIMVNPLRDVDGYHGVKTLLSDVYVQTKTSKNTKLLIGQSRTPIGVEGSMSQYSIPFVFRSQIARNFSNVRAMGVKSTGNYKYADYNLGVYDSTRFMQNFFEGTEFTGWVNLKPLANSEKYGKLVTGTGINTGKRYNSYSVLGTYVGYEYKKFGANFEYSQANGYNGTYNKKNHADGYYSTISYYVHPKVQLLARYDQFNADTKKHNPSKEYSFGVNYFLKGDSIRLAANYILSEKNHNHTSNKFLLMTQLLF